VKGQESKEQVRRDMQVGRERARQDMDRTRERIEGDDVTGPPSRVGTTDTEYEETQVGTVGTRQRPDDPMQGP
jgi:hypothetical protein